MTAKKHTSSNSLSAAAWQRVKKNKLAMLGCGIIAFCLLVAILGYSITPDSTPDANNQLLEISKKPPGFKVTMLQVRKNEADHSSNLFNKMLFGEPSAYRSVPISSYEFKDDKISCIAYNSSSSKKTELSFNLADVVCAVNMDSTVQTNLQEGSITFYDITENKKVKKQISELKQIIEKENIVTQKFILGTDPTGRDLLSRLMLGSRVSFSVGLISVVISICIGMIIGSIGGYYRGKIDTLIVWFINVVWAVPTLLLVIAITLALGKGFWQVFIAVGLTMWVEVARVVRGQVLGLREKEFVEAGRALGFRNSRILFKHVLPNVMGPVIVIAASNFAAAILTEAGLSFLGIGSQPPTPSWGAMISAHRGYIIGDSSYLAFLPGIAIALLVLSFILLGNGLRDALDTKSMDDD
ncbi:MAG TPA: ABC transporter permease, partial [Bacteroidia bacterium]|nr:ABC transporter permease [Bacteroidia bacterium]